MFHKSILIAAGLSMAAGAAGAATEVAVDLSSWTAEGPGSWNRAADNNSVVQTLNDNPTVFHNGTESQGVALSGTIEVQTTGDDDFVGFVLGYDAGDLTDPNADYLLIDWKQFDQGGFFGGVATQGLAISRVTGVLGNDSGAWLHDPANNVTEIARATTLGSLGWADNTEYDFDLVFTSSNVQVFVDDVLELDISGSFANGGFGFYNYSQPSVRYAGLTTRDLPPPAPIIPLPAGLPLLLSALGAAVWIRRRNG